LGSCKNHIQKWQVLSSGMGEFKNHIQKWQVLSSGRQKQNINKLKQRLNQAYSRNGDQTGAEIRNIKKELEILLVQEDEKWKQRAKVDWLKQGDRNTKFYHACANQRRSKNRIQKIIDEEGSTWESPEEIQTAFAHYFSELFTIGPTGDMEKCFQSLQERVSEEMNGELLKIFTKEEVEIALKQMAPLKAPGPDGLLADFFQNHWDLMGEEVCLAVLNSLNSGILPENLNMTHIVLISKKKNPTTVMDFRPISLCNVLYKLISKVLANRLKKILPIIIS
jgi:hypothetical protein